MSAPHPATPNHSTHPKCDNRSRKKTLFQLLAVLTLVLLTKPYWKPKPPSTASSNQPSPDELSGQAELAEFERNLAIYVAQSLTLSLSDYQSAYDTIQQTLRLKTDTPTSPDSLHGLLSLYCHISSKKIRDTINLGITNPDPFIQSLALLLSCRFTEAREKFESLLTQQTTSPAQRHQANLGLAQIAIAEQRYQDALSLYQSAAAKHDKTTDPIPWAQAQTRLASVLMRLSRFSEAEALLRKSLACLENPTDPYDPIILNTLDSLIIILGLESRHRELIPLLRRSIVINQALHGSDHLQHIYHSQDLAQSLSSTGFHDEAVQILRHIIPVIEKQFGADNWMLAAPLNLLGLSLQGLDQNEQAETHLRRALTLYDSQPNPQPADVSIRLSTLAQLLIKANRHIEAEPLLRRAIAISETTSKSDLAKQINNLTLQLMDAKSLTDAEPLARMTVSTLFAIEKKTGYPHPDHQLLLDNYTTFLKDLGHTEAQITAKLAEIQAEADTH